MSQQALQTKNVGGGPPTTRWTIVRALAGDRTARRDALEHFASAYWPPIYSFARLKGQSPPDAEDLTQAFFLSLIERGSFEGLSREKGRFRSWLLASFSHFMSKDWRSRNRLKRGGGVAPLSIDRDLGEDWLESFASEDLSPDIAFDRRWAAGILDGALQKLATIYEQEDKLDIARVIGPMIAGVEARKTYAQAGQELGMAEGTARAAAFRMRKRLRALIREEIANTVESEEQVDAELEHLFSLYDNGGRQNS
jgi:RNA polymerase sigma-70 factor (ECF subfamily)